METTPFGVEAGALLLEAESGLAEQGPAAIGLIYGLGMIRHSLARIAKRVIELDDEILIKEMLHLGVLKTNG